MLYKERKTCRLCNGSLTTVVSLGNIHLSTFLGTDQEAPPKVPVELTVCDDCDLVQLRHTVSGDAMYGDYWYQSGLNDSMVKALYDVVSSVQSRITLSPGDVVVDIGANDGTLLSNYPKDVLKVAVEPSNLAPMGKDRCDILINDYFSARSYFNQVFQKAKVITAIAMFYDLEEPHKFVEDLKSVLAPDGLLVIQMMDLLSMWKYGDFPNLCHEHLEYYSLRTLTNLLRQHGLEIIDLEYNGVNGGSLRVYVQHFGDYYAPAEKLRDALEAEQDYFNSLSDPYQYFRDRIELVKDKIVGFIRLCNFMHKKVAVMGASTKGNTTLQYFELTDEHIVHAAEINPDKFGLRTVGSNIPIIPQHESLAQNPDYYLILPWGFINNFIEKNLDYLKRGGAFLVPLPEPCVVVWDNYLGVQMWPL